MRRSLFLLILLTSCKNDVVEHDSTKGKVSAVQCEALCDQIGTQCEADDENDRENCIQDCREDLVENVPDACTDRAGSLYDCCIAADYEPICRDGSDLDIKRCDAACTREGEALGSCLLSELASCEGICEKIRDQCGEARHSECVAECEQDQQNAASAGDGDDYEELLLCCSDLSFASSCSEDGFDPCSSGACSDLRPASAAGTD